MITKDSHPAILNGVRLQGAGFGVRIKGRDNGFNPFEPSPAISVRAVLPQSGCSHLKKMAGVSICLNISPNRSRRKYLTHKCFQCTK